MYRQLATHDNAQDARTVQQSWSLHRRRPASHTRTVTRPVRSPLTRPDRLRRVATGDGRQLRPSPHRGRAARPFFPSAENQASSAGRAIRSSVHRTSERHALKTVTDTNSQRAVRLTLLRHHYQSPGGHLEMSLAFTIFAEEAYVASWGFCKQKHRSTPFGALAPTRLPVASGQREGPPRKASGARLRRRNLYALPARGNRRNPPFLPGAQRLRRPGRISETPAQSGIENFRACENSLPSTMKEKNRPTWQRQ